MAGKNISMAVIRRLPKYYRYLGDLLDNDVQRISSKELSEIIGFTASQIRQDLNNFGDVYKRQMHRLCGQFNPHLDKMFYYIKIYSKNKLKKFKKKLKIKRIFKTGGEYILKHKKLS